MVDIKKVENRGNVLAKNRCSSYLVQWFSMTKKVQFNELVVWLSGVIGALVLSKRPHPCEIMRGNLYIIYMTGCMGKRAFCDMAVFYK